jgi:hypothetical protein
LDLLGQAEGSAQEYRKMFADVCSEKVEDDGVTFLPGTIRVKKIRDRDEEEYEGIRVLLEARLDKARIPPQIDVGFGDVISPGAFEVEYPTLLTFPAARLRAYPKESVVAEKFEAMVKLGMANSRMKDFYDLWVMAKSFEFRSSVLSAALEATFRKRGTALPSPRPLAFTAEFAESPAMQTQWRAFLGKSGLKADASLPELVKTLDQFLMPVVKGILKKREIFFPFGDRAVRGRRRRQIRNSFSGGNNVGLIRIGIAENRVVCVRVATWTASQPRLKTPRAICWKTHTKNYRKCGKLLRNAEAKPTSGQMDRHGSRRRSVHVLRPQVCCAAVRHEKSSGRARESQGAVCRAQVQARGYLVAGETIRQQIVKGFGSFSHQI